MSEDLEERVAALETKVEEIIKAYNRHRHNFSASNVSECPTYPVKKKGSR